MKKLLSVLSSLGVVASSATTLVSCGVTSSKIETDFGNVQKLEDYAVPSMSSNPVLVIESGILNIISADAQKPVDSSDAKLLGDVNKLSIQYAIDNHKTWNNNKNDDGNYYGGDGWDSFTKAYKSSGNLRFTKALFGSDGLFKMNDSTTKNGSISNDVMNVYTLKLDSNNKIEDTQMTVSDLSKKGVFDSSSTGDELKKEFTTFGSTYLPFGNFLNVDKFELNQDENKYDTNPIDDSKYDDGSDGLAKIDSATTSLSRVRIDAKVNEKNNIIPSDNYAYSTSGKSGKMLGFYQVVDTSSAPIAEFTFHTEKMGDYDLKVTIPELVINYRIGLVSQGINSDTGIKYIATVTPYYYTFSEDIDQTKNIYGSIISNADKFKVEVTKLDDSNTGK